MLNKKSSFYEYIAGQTELYNNNKKTAIGKCMHIITRIIWSMLTYETLFDFEKFKKERVRRKESKIPYENQLDYSPNVFKEISFKDAPISSKMRKIINAFEEKEREAQTSNEVCTSSSRPFPNGNKNNNSKNSQELFNENQKNTKWNDSSVP